MPSARFTWTVRLMAALTVGVYLAEPFLIANGDAPRKAAPEFALATVDGSVVRSADLPEGSVLLVDFMATWCFPCRRQLQDLKELRAEFLPSELTIVTVDEEYGLDPAALVSFRQQFGRVNGSLEDEGWFFAVDTVEEHVGIKFAATALPTVVLVDAGGNIARTWFGAASTPTLAAAIKAELAR